MSRDLKFRGWNTRTNVMYSAEEMGKDQLTLSIDGRGFVNVSGKSTSLSTFPTHIIPMQYAGLKDKDGPEMDWWEDDILEDEDGYRFRIDYLGDVGRYGFLALADLPIENYYFPFYDYQLDELKKVGNIHENPDLLIQENSK